MTKDKLIIFKKIKTIISKCLLFVFLKLKAIKDKIDNKRYANFLHVVDIAYDNGYRERYIKAAGVVMYEKDGLFFNQSGIYVFMNGMFKLTAEIKYKKTKYILNMLKIKQERQENVRTRE